MREAQGSRLQEDSHRIVRDLAKEQEKEILRLPNKRCD